MGEYLRINHAPQTTGFAIAANDAVCRVLQNEFGATSSTVDNPLQTAPSDYEAYEVDMNSQYPTSTRSRHCIWNFVTGAPVTEPIWNIQGLSHKGCSSVGGCTLLDDSGEVYFEQQWGAMTHGESGQDYLYSSETVDPILSHLDDCKDRFGWNHV
uniref:Uncharacterized protein n=1 Tax=Grammatophora oceanica TaxID=210454 RepID=A0A7S1VLL6_9STRA